MREVRKLLVIVLPAAVLVMLLAIPVVSPGPPDSTSDNPTLEAVVAPPSCPGQSWRVIRLHCKKGFSGSAAGEYGGTGFSAFCDNGRTTQTICTDFGNNAYEFVMSAQSSSIAVDCFFSGNKVEVTETCGEVQVTIN